MTRIERILKEMGMPGGEAVGIYRKDGHAVYRVGSGETCILKVFEGETGRREIENYQRLGGLGVPVIRMLAYTEEALLLEDLEASAVWRLGREADMAEPAVARALAAWYRALHGAGREYAALAALYDECDAFTEAHLRALAARVPHPTFWTRLLAVFPALRRLLDGLPRTLVYNDFYWTNLAVARDGSAAVMFDFHLMGKGYAYGDLRNVTSSLTPEAGRVFLDVYGAVDPLEQAVDGVVAEVLTLWTAHQRPTLPPWAAPSLERLAEGVLSRRLEALPL